MLNTFQAGIRPTVAPAALPELRSLRFIDRASALGLAVDYLMTKPAFARAPFGHWSRVLAGQVNRAHYLFICRGRKVVGFAGWALATTEEAEAWHAGRSNPATENGRTGTSVILNAWSADDDDVQDFLLREMRRIARESGIEAIYAMREYADGRSRPLRLGLSGIRAPALLIEHHPSH